MQYFPDILNIRSRGSINKVIFNMLIIHLLLVFFMVPIRSMFFDTIFYRDIILLIMLVLFAGIISLNKRQRRINNQSYKNKRNQMPKMLENSRKQMC